MTEKKISDNKLFLLLNISDFNIFLCKKCNPLKKFTHPSFQATPSINWDPVKAPFWKFGRIFNPPPTEREGGSHYDPTKFSGFWN